MEAHVAEDGEEVALDPQEEQVMPPLEEVVPEPARHDVVELPGEAEAQAEPDLEAAQDGPPGLPANEPAAEPLPPALAQDMPLVRFPAELKVETPGGVIAFYAAHVRQAAELLKADLLD